MSKNSVYEIGSNMEKINLELKDNEWEFNFIDHDRKAARAIVYDENGLFYFCQVHRDDIFGKATLIETSGGGVEEGEDYLSAIKRELKEELGVIVDVICEIGVVSDYYNLIHRHNITHYYLCKICSFGKRKLTMSEKNFFKLTTLALGYEEAKKEYEKCMNTKIGRLIARRELPILNYALEIIKRNKEKYIL